MDFNINHLPYKLTKQALKIEDPDYVMSWAE